MTAENLAKHVRDILRAIGSTATTWAWEEPARACGWVALVHPAEGMESGRISTAEVEWAMLRIRMGDSAARLWLFRIVSERAELTSLQILTYAQLTGPHVHP